MADRHRLLVLLYNCAEDLDKLKIGRKAHLLFQNESSSGTLDLCDYIDRLKDWFSCITQECTDAKYSDIEKKRRAVVRQLERTRQEIKRKARCRNKTIAGSTLGPLKTSITNLKRAVKSTRIPFHECTEKLKEKAAVASRLWPDE